MQTKEKKTGKQNVEALLAEGNCVQIKPRGYSMYPLLVPGRDEVVLAPNMYYELKRGDVVLYRRESGMLVLHRICKRKGNAFYMVGDNQREIEGPLYAEQIKGVMVGVVRKGKSFSVNNPVYRVLSQIWLLMRPIRPVVAKTVAGVKRRVR